VDNLRSKCNQLVNGCDEGCSCMCLAALEGVGGDSRGFVFLFIFRSKARAGLRVLQVPLGLCIRSASSVWSVVRCTAQRIGGLKIRYVIQIRIEGMTGQLFSGGCRRWYDKARLAHLNVTKTSPGTQQRHIRIIVCRLSHFLLSYLSLYCSII